MSSVPATADGRRLRRVGTRQLVLRAATELFARNGVQATSIDDIAKSAGIAKGSVYYNFDSKDDVVGAILSGQTEQVAQLLAQEVKGLSGVPLRRQVVRTLLSRAASEPDVTRLMVTEALHTDRSWRDSTAAWREATTRALNDDLDLERGPDPRNAVHAAAIVGATLSASLEWLAFRPELPQSDVLAGLLAALGLSDSSGEPDRLMSAQESG